MKLHEYQTKALFRDYGIPIPQGAVADSPQAAADSVRLLQDQHFKNSEPYTGIFVVKAQVHAGGRGKGGGVALVDSAEAAADAARKMLGTQLVTPQTDAHGLPVNSVLVERGWEIAREIYLGLLVDRETRRIVIMASAAGGMDIEQVAAETPEKIIKQWIDPIVGLQAYQCRNIGFALELDKPQIAALSGILDGLYRLFIDCDASLLEINPLIVTAADRNNPPENSPNHASEHSGAGKLIALDAKLNIDDSALYRHKRLRSQRDETQEDPRELAAAEHQLNYIALDGDIACMVNGAGLAMATMDLIQLHGGSPANFLDVGGGTTPERVAEAFKLILSDTKVKSILVNIFGGIVRCDLIAEGIIRAIGEIHVTVPVIVRLEGTNVEQGRAMLEDSGLAVITADGLTDAAQKAVAAAQPK